MNFLTWVYKVSNTRRFMGKHEASKKGYKHQHNLSKGQKKSAYKSLVREALNSETPIENEIERFSELK